MGDKLGVVVASSVRAKHCISVALGGERHEQSLWIPATPGEWSSQMLSVHPFVDVDLKFIHLHAGWSSSTSELAAKVWGPLAQGLDPAMKVIVGFFTYFYLFYPLG